MSAVNTVVKTVQDSAQALKKAGKQLAEGLGIKSRLTDEVIGNTNIAYPVHDVIDEIVQTDPMAAAKSLSYKEAYSAYAKEWDIIDPVTLTDLDPDARALGSELDRLANEVELLEDNTIINLDLPYSFQIEYAVDDVHNTAEIANVKIIGVGPEDTLTGNPIEGEAAKKLLLYTLNKFDDISSGKSNLPVVISIKSKSGEDLALRAANGEEVFIPTVTDKGIILPTPNELETRSPFKVTRNFDPEKIDPLVLYTETPNDPILRNELLRNWVDPEFQLSLYAPSRRIPKNIARNPARDTHETFLDLYNRFFNPEISLADVERTRIEDTQRAYNNYARVIHQITELNLNESRTFQARYMDWLAEKPNRLKPDLFGGNPDEPLIMLRTNLAHTVDPETGREASVALPRETGVHLGIPATTTELEERALAEIHNAGLQLQVHYTDLIDRLPPLEEVWEPIWKGITDVLDVNHASRSGVIIRDISLLSDARRMPEEIATQLAESIKNRLTEFNRTGTFPDEINIEAITEDPELFRDFVRDLTAHIAGRIKGVTESAYVARIEKPLILADASRFSPAGVVAQIKHRPEFANAITDMKFIEEFGNSINEDSDLFIQATKKLHKLLESRGYDSIMYSNVYEPGDGIAVPSFILWKEDTFKHLGTRTIKEGVSEDTPIRDLWSIGGAFLGISLFGSQIQKENKGS